MYFVHTYVFAITFTFSLNSASFKLHFT